MTLNARLACIVLPLCVASSLQGQVRMRAGLWENTVSSSGQTATRNACITPEQEEHSKGSTITMRESVEKALAKSGACKLTEFSISGNNLTQAMVCSKTTIKTSTTFHGDSFETTSTATSPEGVKTSLMKGRRIGECPAGGAH